MKTFSQRIAQFCSSHGLKLNRDLGQHFLIDDEALAGIVEAAGIQPEDHVVEIGPGIGILTRELLKCAKHVTTIELDSKLIPLLNKYLSSNEQPFDKTQSRQANELTILHGNALTTPLPEHPCIIVANIPYHITSPLLRHIFLESSVRPRSLTLLIQREVAEKICDTEHRGILTILVSLFGAPHLMFTVPPQSFLPPPKVDSAVLHIECFAEPIADRETIDRIFSLTKIAFGQKRKMLRNSIGTLERGMAMLKRVGIDPERRPETLTVEEWVKLAEER
ncbi:ribosomal RNA small subunit methyltransferase A [Candidatus Peregrinibacteria bacterium]|nr:ribosomal RNA small subunit methyltransferase A [Candidatus Peregrinibacteria bacterium]MBI3816162.1 ribosomal RNA small subunit methyltransferase A [Candidatus Peregrinibacteria bacterium]